MPHLPTPPGTGRGIIKGELLRYLGTNSNEATFQTHKEKHVQNLKKRCYRQEVIDKSIKEIYFSDRPKTLVNKPHNAGERPTFTATYSPHLPTHRLRRWRHFWNYCTILLAPAPWDMHFGPGNLWQHQQHTRDTKQPIRAGTLGNPVHAPHK